MGEETKQEQPPVGAQPEEKAEEKPPAPPPPPFVLFVDLHCVGCAKKIEKSIMRIKGVEGVAIDMAQNQVTIKGVIEPQAVCDKIMKKTKRRAKVLSPLPAADGEPIPQVVASQVSGLATVELNVDMHCQACAEQLKRKILKLRGVQSAATEHSTGKVTVTGTIDANKLVDYLYRRTKKQARIVPQPEPQPEPEPEPEPQPEPEKQEEKKEEVEKPAEEAKPEEDAEKKEENPPEETDKKEDGGENKEEEKKEAAEAEEGINGSNNMNNEEESMRRMIYYYQPLYVIERMPPAPQLFSDENPNACCIS